MPIGVICNATAIIIGGIIGTFAGKKLNNNWKDNMNMVFSICSMSMGISTIVLMKNMPAVILAMLIGTALGLLIHFGEIINKAGAFMQQGVSRFIPSENSTLSPEEFQNTLVTIIVLFCASGTGIYGSIISGMTGDHSILIAKSMLDIFTSMIFACSLGLVVSVIAIPQFIIFTCLFLMAGVIYPCCTPDMIADFKACGGFIMLATGFRMVKMKNYPTADMIPAMVLVMPFSWIWSTYILPYVS